MKKFMKKITLAALAGVGMLSVGFGTVSLQANADNVAPAPVVSIEQKAAIRKEGPMGIRFTANVANVEALEEAYDDVVYGMLITPADYLTEGKTLFFGGGLTEYTEGGVATGTYRNKTAIPDEAGKMYGSFVGINESNYSRPFAARAYVGVKNEGDVDYAYSYSDVCTRAVYTVASYAVMDTAEGYSDEVTTYLNGVVSKVHTAYTTLNVDLGASVFDGTNNTVNLNATVSNGVRTLETGVAIDSDNMTQKDFTTYEVDTLGTFTATASVGNLSLDINDLTCTTIKANNVDEDIYPSTVSTATATLCDAAGRTNVIKWGGTGSYTTSALHFADPVGRNMKAGTYISFDLWTDKGITPAWDGQGTWQFYGVSNATDRKFFGEDGWQLNTSGFWGNDSTMLNKWITVELQLPANYVGYLGTQWQGLQMLTTAWESANVYLDNFKVSTVGKTNPTEATILASKADLDNGNMYASSKVALSYVSDEIDGKSGVFKWSTTSETDVMDQPGTMLKFKKTTATENLMKNGAWVSFDLYVDATAVPRIAVNFGSDIMLYNTTSNDNIKLYDENGVQLTKTMWVLGASAIKQWIHVEVRLTEDFNFDSNYRGLHIYPTSPSNFNNTTNIYLANVKVTAPTAA